jgi:hypothetical protein
MSVFINVADLGGLSRIRDSDFSIPDPTRTKKRRGKFILVLSFI